MEDGGECGGVGGECGMGVKWMERIVGSVEGVVRSVEDPMPGRR